jgi:hypothetical protein
VSAIVEESWPESLVRASRAKLAARAPEVHDLGAVLECRLL